VFIEHVCGKNGTNDGGKGHSPSSSAYRRGRIASKSWRRSRRRGQVEGYYVDENIGSLRMRVLASTSWCLILFRR
jgi:hypothetical protein